MSKQPQSLQQKKLRQNIEERQENINQFFQNLGIQESAITNNNQTNQDQQEQVNSQTINSRGETLRSFSDIKNDYDNAFFLWKWIYLPVCTKTLKSKIKFDLLFSPFMTISFGLFFLSRRKIQNISWQYFLKLHIGITAFICTCSFIQSIFFEPYCDINSEYYNPNLTGLSRARMIKKQLNSL